MQIFSVTNDDNYQRFEFVLLPCNYVHSEFEDRGDTVHPDCDANLENQKKYLGNMKSIIYIEEENFFQDEFGNISVQKRSKFYS